MTVLRSLDEGATWEVFRSIDRGAVAYSALQIIPPPSTSAYSISPKSASSKAGKASYQDQPQPLYELTDRRSQENELRSHLSPSILGLLYERSDNMSIVFAPDQILFVPILLG